MSENIPETTIPITTEELHYQVARIYGDLGQKQSMSEIMDRLTDSKVNNPAKRIEYANIYFKELFDTTRALSILESLHAEFLQLESMVNLQGFGSKSVTQKKWYQWQHFRSRRGFLEDALPTTHLSRSERPKNLLCGRWS